MTLTVNGTQVEMVIDTGASLILISKATYDKLQSSTILPPLTTEQIKLRTYTGEEIRVLGSISVTAQSETSTCTLSLSLIHLHLISIPYPYHCTVKTVVLS